MCRILAFAQVAIVRRAHWASTSVKVSGEVAIRVTRGRAVSSTIAAASSGAVLPIALRRTREGVSIIVQVGGAGEGVRDQARGQFSTNDPCPVTNEEGSVSGLSH